jgi:hypothetical protein
MKPIYLLPILLLAGCSKHNASTQPYVDATPQADIESLINAEAERLYAIFRAPKEAKSNWGQKPKVGSDGIAIVIKDHVTSNAHDPKELEFLDSTPLQRPRAGWMQMIKFRAKNGFGAKMVYERGYVVLNERIIGEFPEEQFSGYVEMADKVEAEDKADWDMALQTATVTVKAKFKKL